jgi:hypothetical protein
MKQGRLRRRHVGLLAFPNPANRLLQVGLLSPIANKPLSSATKILAMSLRSCSFISNRYLKAAAADECEAPMQSHQ